MSISTLRINGDAVLFCVEFNLHRAVVGQQIDRFRPALGADEVSE